MDSLNLPAPCDAVSCVASHAYRPYDDFVRQHLPAIVEWPILQEPTASNAENQRATLLYPAQMNCVDELLGESAMMKFADNPALIGITEHFSYRQLAQEVDRTALVLRDDFDVRPGMRVLLRAPNSPQLAIVLLAVIKIGAIAVPSMPLLRARELAEMIDKAQINLAVCTQALLSELLLAQRLVNGQNEAFCFTTLCLDNPDKAATDDSAIPSLPRLAKQKMPVCPAYPSAQDDVCLLAFTSGTTGKAKATAHFHRDLLTICDLFPASHLQLTSADVVIGTPSLAFTFGLGALLLFPLRYGASSVLQSYANPEALWQRIASAGASICFSAPSFYRKMALIAPKEQSSLRLVVSAGEALPVPTRQLWQSATQVTMIDGLGATEMLHIFVASAPQHERIGAIGRAIAGYRVAIFDEFGQLCPPNIAGRLAVQGLTGCRYLADARQTEYVQQGWNFTGDTCLMDEDAYVYYLGRSDDMIISSGYNIAPREVEEVLLQLPTILECAVIGLPDEERGQIVVAFVVLQQAELSQAELAELSNTLQIYVKGELAPYKYPRQIRFLSSLPRTESGKLQRYKLRANLFSNLCTNELPA